MQTMTAVLPTPITTPITTPTMTTIMDITTTTIMTTAITLLTRKPTAFLIQSLLLVFSLSALEW